MRTLVCGQEARFENERVILFFLLILGILILILAVPAYRGISQFFPKTPCIQFLFGFWAGKGKGFVCENKSRASGGGPLTPVPLPAGEGCFGISRACSPNAPGTKGWFG
jgi:hypothetical protein